MSAPIVRRGLAFHDVVTITTRGHDLRGKRAVVTGWGPEDYVRVRIYVAATAHATGTPVSVFVRRGALRLMEYSSRRERHVRRRAAAS